MGIALGDSIQGVMALVNDLVGADTGFTVLRTIAIYLFTLAIVRLGSKRFLSEASAFDVIVAIMLGSIMSRAINGSNPLVPALVGGVVLVGLHWLFGIFAFRTDWFGSLVKGNPVLLVRDGKIQWQGMRRTSVSLNDLDQALRLQGELPDPSKIRLSYLERNGKVSIVPCKGEPRVIVVPVQDGVQTVRIEID